MSLLATCDPDRDVDFIAMARQRGIRSVLLDEAQVETLSETVTSQGLFAVCQRLASDELPVLEDPRLVVICAQVRDPGNAGTVIRCADAFAADAVILTRGSVDPHNPKTVRALSLIHI